MPTQNDYSRVNLGSNDTSYKRTERESPSGEFGNVHGQTLPEVGDDLVPTPGNNPRQFSSRQGNPEALLDSTRQCVKDHANLNIAYGLTQPEALLGTHPWLRDSLATPGEDEPGNAAPRPGQKTPEVSRG